MYLGACYPSSKEQASRVQSCLRDLNFIGVLGDPSTNPEPENIIRRGSVKEEDSNEWSLGKASISRDLINYAFQT